MNRTFAICITAIVLLARPAWSGPDTRAQRRTPVVEVVERVWDSIVNISATGRVKYERRSPFFDVWPMPPIERETHSVGSGFVLHKSGYIVTNAHVVDRAIDLKVTFADGQEHQAYVVVSDPVHDLAVVRVRGAGQFKPIPMGRSDDLMPGETVVAIGNPLGYANTVTTGIISALGRRIDVSADTFYDDLIQTDAGINPGNSGGPLMNIAGDLIGITTAIRADAQNIGFAIPVDQLRTLLPAMFDYAMGEERRFRLGMRVEGAQSPRVVEVSADSPASEAGVRVGDELTSLDGEPVARDVDFYIAMMGHNVGDRVPLSLRRDGESRQTTLTLTEPPKPDGAALAKSKFGLVIEELSPAAGRLFGVKSGAGVLVMDVLRGSPADRAGCNPGDLIVRIGRNRISSPDDLGPLLDGIQSDTPADLTLWRIHGGDVYEYPGVRVYAR